MSHPCPVCGNLFADLPLRIHLCCMHGWQRQLLTLPTPSFSGLRCSVAGCDWSLPGPIPDTGLEDALRAGGRHLAVYHFDPSPDDDGPLAASIAALALAPQKVAPPAAAEERAGGRQTALRADSGKFGRLAPVQVEVNAARAAANVSALTAGIWAHDAAQRLTQATATNHAKVLQEIRRILSSVMVRAPLMMVRRPELQVTSVFTRTKTKQNMRARCRFRFWLKPAPSQGNSSTTCLVNWSILCLTSGRCTPQPGVRPLRMTVTMTSNQMVQTRQKTVPVLRKELTQQSRPRPQLPAQPLSPRLLLRRVAIA